MENNKLIAEFMGIELKPNECGRLFRYHKEWNWLMPVVEKIENFMDGEQGDSIRGHRYNVDISHCSCEITGECPEIHFQEATKKKATYKAVVEFIKWYNPKQR